MKKRISFLSIAAAALLAACSGSDHGELVGVWVDDTGKVWVDRVWHYPELEEALEVARINNQLAIWDNANGKEIRL